MGCVLPCTVGARTCRSSGDPSISGQERSLGERKAIYLLFQRGISYDRSWLVAVHDGPRCHTYFILLTSRLALSMGQIDAGAKSIIIFLLSLPYLLLPPTRILYVSQIDYCIINLQYTKLWIHSCHHSCNISGFIFFIVLYISPFLLLLLFVFPLKYKAHESQNYQHGVFSNFLAVLYIRISNCQGIMDEWE